MKLSKKRNHPSAWRISSDLAKGLLDDPIGMDKDVSVPSNHDTLENDGVQPASIMNYEIFKGSLQTAPLTNVNDKLDFRSNCESIPIKAVKSGSEIMRRFCTGAMLLGVLVS